MRSKFLIGISLIIVVGAGLYFVFPHFKWEGRLVSPEIFGKVMQKVEPTITTNPKPKQFKFDSSTNLEQELDSVNPKVHDSDFEQLKILIKEI